MGSTSQNRLTRGFVLIVDDEAAILRAFSAIIRRLGFTAVTASEPAIGLALIEVRRFDAVLSDLHIYMPDGRAFAAAAATAAPTTPIVVATGEESLREVYRRLGGVAVDAILSKPVDPATLARYLERAIDHGRISSQDTDSEARVIADGLVRALALRDIETENHSRRVAAWARMLGKAIGLTGNVLVQCELGALLHDVGKIGVPDRILRKPAKLDDAEWTIMRKHPLYGKEMVAGIAQLAGASEVVYGHHERWDGAGYPRGLAGEAIPVGARIFAVVDSYDAMTSDRCYRKGMPHEVAIEEIRRLAGSQYDPSIVATFLAIDQREWRAVREIFTDQVDSEAA